MGRIKRMSWEKYYKTQQEVYLDIENPADQEIKFNYYNNSGENVVAKAMNGLMDKDVFPGYDDEFVVIEFDRARNFESYLLYDCTWDDVDKYLRRKGYRPRKEENKQ